jgi:DNA-binding NarL/FixJ family response regulator
MRRPEARCVLLANPHHGMSESIRGLLSTTFEAVVIVADEISLLESASRLNNDLAVVDPAVSKGSPLELVSQLRARFPDMKVIIVGAHNVSSMSEAVLAAGADGYITKRSIATDLLSAADAVLAGKQYVSSDVKDYPSKLPSRS